MKLYKLSGKRTMPKSVRELILEVQGEVRENPDLMPNRAAEILNLLASLAGNVNQEILERDIAYNRVLLGFYESEGKANRAKIKAEISDEYRAKMEARNTQSLAKDIMGSLKYYLRVKQEEYQSGKYQ